MSSRRRYHLLLTHRSELCAGQHHMKMYKDLSNSRKMAFNMKKLLNDIMDLALWRRDGRKRRCMWNEGSSCRFLLPKKPVSAGEWINAEVFCQEPLRQLWSPGSRGTYPDEIKIHLPADLGLVDTTRTTRQLVQFWTQADWPL